MKILIAEDDRVSRTFMEKFMSEYGTCDTAVDGMEALDLFMESLKQKQPYDLACLDIMMPKVDGIKVLRVIRAMEEQHGIPAEEHLKIIMMTALSDIEYVDKAFELGCDAYASKPVDTEKIGEVLKKLGICSKEKASGREGV